jgi:predicted nicotinamide N-methyase
MNRRTCRFTVKYCTLKPARRLDTDSMCTDDHQGACHKKGSTLTAPSAAFRASAQLLARLVHKFRLVEQSVPLPQSGMTYAIFQPATFDRLLTVAAGDPEQQLPYWATIWPSGIALADLVLQQHRQFAGQRVLELGSGLGVTAAAALSTGALLHVTDYSPETLLLCRLNTLRNTGRQPQTLRINWRQPSDALVALAQPRFPLILAADVLYEKRDVQPLLALIERLLAPDGTLWLAEPGRPPAQHFVETAIAGGWRDDLIQHPGPWPDPQDADVVVNIHRLRRDVQ